VQQIVHKQHHKHTNQGGEYMKHWTDRLDDYMDQKEGIKEGSRTDKSLDKKRGVPEDDTPKKKSKKLKLNPPSKGYKPAGAHGRAAVHALGRTKTTGNFKKIEAAKGKGAAITAYQNALKAHKAGK